MASTRILFCDPSSIVFHDSSVTPRVTCPDTQSALKIAVHHLVDLKQPVVFPTETVYGLGALALDDSASAKIFRTKGRPPDNPLIVHVSSLSMLHSLLPSPYSISPAYRALIKHFWPGALTLLFPRRPQVIPAIITANQPSVAVRMPSHPVARALIALANAPLAAPSANTSGKPSPTRVEHLSRDLDGKVNIILDGGPCGVGLESTVIDGLNPDGNLRVLRPGGITVEDIEAVLRQEITDSTQIPKVLVHKRDYRDEQLEAAPTTPGMKYRHYSPSVPVTLLLTRSHSKSPSAIDFLDFTQGLSRQATGDNPPKIGLLAPSNSKIWGHLDRTPGIEWHRYELGPSDSPAITAFRLFDGLLTLEKQGVELMLIEEIGEDREGLAVMNRVRKAAGSSISIRC